MTRDEFLWNYRTFRTPDPQVAARAALPVRVDGEQVVVVRIGDEYCLMLLSAVGSLIDMGIVDAVKEVHDPRNLAEPSAPKGAPDA